MGFLVVFSDAGITIWIVNEFWFRENANVCVQRKKAQIYNDEIKQPKLDPILCNIMHFQSANSFARLFDTCKKHKAIDFFMISSECQQRKKKTSRQTKRMNTNKTVIESNRAFHLNKKNRLNKNSSFVYLFGQHNYKENKSCSYIMHHASAYKKSFYFMDPVSGANWKETIRNFISINFKSICRI